MELKVELPWCQVTTTTPNNTPRAIAKEDSSIIWSWESKPFGETKPNQDPDKDGTTFTLNLRFPGHYADSESELYYNFNRYYSPKLGRYITSDPIGFEGGVNTYLYAGADPVGKVDPEGEDYKLIQAFIPAFLAEYKLYKYNKKMIDIKYLTKGYIQLMDDYGCNNLNDYLTPDTINMYAIKKSYCENLSRKLSQLIMEKELKSIDRFKRLFK